MKVFLEHYGRGTRDQRSGPTSPARPHARCDNATQAPRDLKTMLEQPDTGGQPARDRSGQAPNSLAHVDAARIMHGHILGISR